MKKIIWAISILVAFSSNAQLNTNGNVDLSTAPPASKHISGLPLPANSEELVSLVASSSGWAHWYSIQVQQLDTIRLTGAIPFGRPANGFLLRFKTNSAARGATWIGYTDSLVFPLLDTEGRALTKGRYVADQIIQAQWSDTAFYLSNAPTTTCPAGYLRVNETLCIQQDDNSTVDWFQANEACEKQGAGLCTFAEYVHACRHLDVQLSGLFNNWEWIDDTSDHTHTADQAGRWNCHSNRSRGATNQDFANYRCCYLLR